MNAEIIAIGTELLLGEITDTNSTVIARALRRIGLNLWWISIVGDNEVRIAELVAEASRRSTVVITTGGLGPTVDDPTRGAVARAFDRTLEFRPELWQQIEARFERYGRKPTENNRRQAYVPAGAVPFENPVGTAPCFALEHEGGVVIALPGVPREMEYMLEHVVLPYLQQKFKFAALIRSKVLRTVGIGESLIDERIGDLELMSNPTVGLAAHPGQVDIRITAKAASEDEADAMIAPLEATVRERLGDFIYGEGTETVEEVVGRMLVERGMTVAVAEAGTGGHLAQRLSAVPQAALVVRVPQEDVSTIPVVDLDGVAVQLPAPVAQLQVNAPALSAGALAEAARSQSSPHTDWGLGVVVTLDGDPVQLEIALAGAERTDVRPLAFGGHSGLAIQWVSTAALNLLRLELLRHS